MPNINWQVFDLRRTEWTDYSQNCKQFEISDEIHVSNFPY